MSNLEKTLSKMSLIAILTDAPYILLSNTGKLMSDRLDSTFINPLYKLNNKFVKSDDSLASLENSRLPRIRKTEFLEYYLIIPLPMENGLGKIIIGPTVPSKVSEEQILSIIKDNNAIFIKNQLFMYYQNLIINSYNKLVNIAVILHEVFNDEIIESEDIINFSSSDNDGLVISTNPEIEVLNNLQFGYSHDRKFENEVLSIVKSGDINAINKLKFIKQDEHVTLYSKESYLRSLKNHIITLIALVSREVINEGVNIEEAISLSDYFIIKLEESTSMKGAKEVAAEMIITFINKVSDVDTRNYSATIKRCREYIYKNLLNDIDHEALARELSISPSYLSTLFKKETGMTISKYIQEKKVKEAKYILKYTDISISEVSSYLNFTDQSYFTKVFKYHTGMTPIKYKQNGSSEKGFLNQ